MFLNVRNLGNVWRRRETSLAVTTPNVLVSTSRRLPSQRFVIFQKTRSVVSFFSSRWKRHNRLLSGLAVPHLTFPSSPQCQRTHLPVSFTSSGVRPATCPALGLRPEAGHSSATAGKGRGLAAVQNLHPRGRRHQWGPWRQLRCARMLAAASSGVSVVQSGRAGTVTRCGLGLTRGACGSDPAFFTDPRRM